MKKNANNLIIIAENSLTQAEQLKHILTKNGYRVLHGRNGKDAFDLIRENEPLLVISCQQGLKQPGIILTESHTPECAGCPISKKSSYKGSMTVRLEYEGEIYGMLTIRLSPDIKTDKEENDLLYEVAGDISFALYSINVEEKHRQAEDALRKSEEKHKIIFEGSADGILVADIETKKFNYANPAICKMLGYTNKEIKGMGVADIHPKDSLEHVISEFEAQARGEKTLAYNIPCLRKDGTIIYANINTSIVLFLSFQ